MPEINNSYILNCTQFYTDQWNFTAFHSTPFVIWIIYNLYALPTYSYQIICHSVTVVVINLIWQQSTTMDIGSILIVSCYNCSILLVLLLISYSACLRYAYIEKAQDTLQSLVLSWASGKGETDILYECVCVCMFLKPVTHIYKCFYHWNERILVVWYSLFWKFMCKTIKLS